MNIAYFTKSLEGLPLEKAAEITAGLGFDCADLLVRDGQAVTPERPEEIVKAAKLFAAGGLRVPMATIDAIRPDDAASRLLGFCGEAGIGQVRLGFWRYDPSQRWKVQVDEARRDLDGFERLAERFAVKLTIQLHGGTLHSSGALAMHLLAGRDPVRIGAYPDPANQVIREGTEDWRLTLDLLDPWFCCMGVKNSGWFPGVYGAEGQRTWHSDWYGLDDGMVPWNEIIPHLVATALPGCSRCIPNTGSPGNRRSTRSAPISPISGAWSPQRKSKILREQAPVIAVLLTEKTRRMMLDDAATAELNALGEVRWPTGATIDAADADRLLQGATACLTGWGTPPFDPAARQRHSQLALVAHSAGSVRTLVPAGLFEDGLRVSHAASKIAISVANSSSPKHCSPCAAFIGCISDCARAANGSTSALQCRRDCSAPERSASSAPAMSDGRLCGCSFPSAAACWSSIPISATARPQRSASSEQDWTMHSLRAM